MDSNVRDVVIVHFPMFNPCPLCHYCSLTTRISHADHTYLSQHNHAPWRDNEGVAGKGDHSINKREHRRVRWRALLKKVLLGHLAV